VPGLTFTPETDDMRDAPSPPIIARMVQDGAMMRAFAPKSVTKPNCCCLRRSPIAVMRWVPRPRRTLFGVDHRMERVPRALAGAARGRHVDPRNVYEPEAMTQAASIASVWADGVSKPLIRGHAGLVGRQRVRRSRASATSRGRASVSGIEADACMSRAGRHRDR
jgi:hypothetical protein